MRVTIAAILALTIVGCSHKAPDTAPQTPERQVAKYGSQALQLVNDVQKGLDAAHCGPAPAPCLSDEQHAVTMGATLKVGTTAKQLAGYLRDYDMATNPDAALLDRIKTVLNVFDGEVNQLLNLIPSEGVRTEVKATVQNLLQLITTIRSELHLTALNSGQSLQLAQVPPIAGIVQLLNLLLPIVIGAYRRVRDDTGDVSMKTDAEIIDMMEADADTVINHAMASLSQTEAGRKWLADNGFSQE